MWASVLDQLYGSQAPYSDLGCPQRSTVPELNQHFSCPLLPQHRQFSLFPCWHVDTSLVLLYRAVLILKQDFIHSEQLTGTCYS